MPTRWLIAAGAGLIAMMGFASRGAFGVFFVQMLEEYPWDRASLAGVYSVGMLVMGFAGVWAGGLSQRIGPKRYFLVGAAVVGLTFVLASTARTLFQVYLTYGVLGGISLAMLGLGPTQALVARWFDTRRGLALGIVAAGAGAYSLVAPLAQVLVDAVGWRQAMVLMGAILFLVVAGLGLFVMQEPPASRPSRAPGPAAPRRAGGAASWTLRDAMRTRPLWFIALAWFFMSFTIHFVNSQLIALLVDAGHSAMVASWVLGVVGICSVANRAIAGGVSDRIGRVRTFAGGAALAAAGIVVLALRDPGSGTWSLYLFAVLFGLGTGAQTTQTASLASDLYRGPGFAAILGFITLGFGTGGATGPWLAGLVYEWSGSYDAMLWFVLAALAGGALAMAGARRAGSPAK